MVVGYNSHCTNVKVPCRDKLYPVDVNNLLFGAIFLSYYIIHCSHILHKGPPRSQLI